MGYARRSTDRQEQSVGDQRKAVEAYAAKEGYSILDWYVDDAISGAGTDDRKAFLRIVEEAGREDCPFNTILVYDVKRFGRLDNDETGYYRHLLKKAGVEVVYISENFNGDDTDDLLRPVKQWQARQELKDLSKVTIRGQLSRSEGGWWMGGSPPYGYDLAYVDGAGRFLLTLRYLPDGAKQVLDADGTPVRTLSKGDSLNLSKKDRARLVLSAPGRVKAIRRIFDLYLREGLGFKGVAAKLNEEGIPSPRHRQDSHGWAMTTVREIVMNPAYTGDMVWNRRSYAKFHRIEGRRATPTTGIKPYVVEFNDEADWIVSRDSHPAIVTRELFIAARARRLERGKQYKRSYRRGRGATSDFLLTGVIHCDHCGHHWQGYTTQKGRRRKDGSKVITQYYACGGYVTKGNAVCKRSLVSKEPLENLILDAIGENVALFLEEGGDAILRTLIEEQIENDAPGTEGELQTLRTQRTEIERKINNLLDNITQANREFADKRLTELKRELYEIRPRLEELEAAQARTVDVELVCAEMLTAMKDFRKLAAEGTVDEKRTLIRAFAKEIRLDPQSGEGRAQLYMLPDLPVATRHEPATEKSSLIMVAGARYVAEKRRSVAAMAFTFAPQRLDIVSLKRPVFAASRLCA